MAILKGVLHRDGITAITIFISTFLVKIPFLWNIRNDATFKLPIIDCFEFNTWALRIIHEHFLWASVQNHTPLYAYFVALVYAIFGYNTFYVAIIQYALFSASTALLYFIAARVFNKTTALITCVFMTFYWFFIYVQSFLYSENLSLFLNILLIWCLLFTKDAVKKYFACGIIFGLSVICRPEILLFAVFILLWFIARKITIKKIAEFYFIFLFALALVVFPVILRNYIISGEVMLRSQTGANIYLGNNPDLKGTNIDLEIGDKWRNFITMPHKALNKIASLAECDRYYISETIKKIHKDPMAWARLIVFKTFTILSGREFLRTEDVYVFKNYVLSTPFCLISTKVIFLFGIIGLLFSFRKPKDFLLLYIFIVSTAIIIFFPIKTRYLMPVMPFVAAFSSFGILKFYNALVNKKFASIALMIASIAFFNFFSFYNPLGITIPDLSETYYAIGKNYYYLGENEKAKELYLSSLCLNPKNGAVFNDLGLVYRNSGDQESALKYFKKAIELDDTNDIAKKNYRECLTKGTGHFVNSGLSPI